MPYRLDIPSPPLDAVDMLISLGALDIEAGNDRLAAMLPDAVTPDTVASALACAVSVSPAIGRDNGSTWLLSPQPILIGGNALQLIDSDAFGTGHHPTTALCIEAIEEIVNIEHPDSILDVGTGSGILALAALIMGVPQAVGVDIDANALQIAAENARLNNLEHRLQLHLGGPDVIDGNWPLVVANVLVAPLIDMAPVVVRRLSNRGWLVLSGIANSLEPDVERAYQRCGVGRFDRAARSGWSVLIARAIYSSA